MKEFSKNNVSLTWSSCPVLSCCLGLFVCSLLGLGLPCCFIWGSQSSVSVLFHVFSSCQLLLSWWCHLMMTSAWACLLIVVSVMGVVALDFTEQSGSAVWTSLHWFEPDLAGCINTEPHPHSVVVCATVNILSSEAWGSIWTQLQLDSIGRHDREDQVQLGHL